MEYCNEQLLCVLNTSAERKLKKIFIFENRNTNLKVLEMQLFQISFWKANICYSGIYNIRNVNVNIAPFTCLAGYDRVGLYYVRLKIQDVCRLCSRLEIVYRQREIIINSTITFILWNRQHKQFLVLRHKVDTSSLYGIKQFAIVVVMASM